MKLAGLFAVLAIIILTSGCVTTDTVPETGEAADYFLEKEAGYLERGDEVVLEEQSFFFQYMEDYGEAQVELTFTDSGGEVVSIIANPTDPVPVKVVVPPGGAIPPGSSPVPPVTPIAVPVPTPSPVNVTPPAPPTAPVPTPPNVTPAPSPLPPNATNVTVPVPNVTNTTPTPSAVCGNGIVESNEQCEPPNTATCDANCMNIIPSYPANCYNSAWDGDESDMDCGGSCPQCLCTGIYFACWDASDCVTGNCDVSNATRPLPPGYNIPSLRQLAGQAWIIPYQGRCV